MRVLGVGVLLSLGVLLVSGTVGGVLLDFILCLGPFGFGFSIWFLGFLVRFGRWGRFAGFSWIAWAGVVCLGIFGWGASLRVGSWCFAVFLKVVL